MSEKKKTGAVVVFWTENPAVGNQVIGLELLGEEVRRDDVIAALQTVPYLGSENPFLLAQSFAGLFAEGSLGVTSSYCAAEFFEGESGKEVVVRLEHGYTEGAFVADDFGTFHCSSIPGKPRWGCMTCFQVGRDAGNN